MNFPIDFSYLDLPTQLSHSMENSMVIPIDNITEFTTIQ